MVFWFIIPLLRKSFGHFHLDGHYHYNLIKGDTIPYPQCAMKRCCTCPHAQIQVHSRTQNLMMTPHQPRANCQPPHTLPVSEKSCGFVEVHRGGCHYHTATNRLDSFWHTQLQESSLSNPNSKKTGKVWRVFVGWMETFFQHCSPLIEWILPSHTDVFFLWL